MKLEEGSTGVKRFEMEIGYKCGVEEGLSELNKTKDIQKNIHFKLLKIIFKNIKILTQTHYMGG